jgi:signal transduction histidine kinase
MTTNFELLLARLSRNRSPLVLFVAATFLGLALFLLLMPTFGMVAGAAAFVPGGVAAMRWGRRAALPFAVVSGLTMEAVGYLVYGRTPYSPGETLFGIALIAIGGLVVGRMREQEQALAEAERARLDAEAAARMALQESLAAVGTLASGVAHEINNPLIAVTLNVQFALEEIARLPNAGPELTAALRDAEAGCQRLSSIARDMGRVVRLPEANRHPVDLAEAVRAATNLASGALRGRVALTIELTPVGRVTATETELGQVVMNLVVNAAQAMPTRPANENHVAVRTRVGAAGRVLVEVEDNGAGISEDVASKIFKPFFTTKPAGVGTGLGLWVCSDIVRRLGGTLTFHSTVGKGTTFCIEFPAQSFNGSP